MNDRNVAQVTEKLLVAVICTRIQVSSPCSYLGSPHCSISLFQDRLDQLHQYKQAMAGPVRQPIDVGSLSNYIENNVPEIKLPILIKQVPICEQPLLS